jgi:hypothetical protein
MPTKALASLTFGMCTTVRKTRFLISHPCVMSGQDITGPCDEIVLVRDGAGANFIKCDSQSGVKADPSTLR